MKVNSCSAPAVVCAIDGAAARAVAEDEVRILPHLNLLGTVACKGLAVQAQIQRLSLSYFQAFLDRDAIRQADIGGVIVTIIDGRSAVPRLICHIRMACVVAHIGIAAAGAMGVRRRCACGNGDIPGDLIGRNGKGKCARFTVLIGSIGTAVKRAAAHLYTHQCNRCGISVFRHNHRGVSRTV